MTTVRRCQGWIVAHKRDGMVAGVAQCEKPADWDGRFCTEHKDVKIEEWMPRAD